MRIRYVLECEVFIYYNCSSALQQMNKNLMKTGNNNDYNNNTLGFAK